MVITQNPKRKADQKAKTFISGVSARTQKANKKAIMIRVEPELLERIDSYAKRLGLSRSAFLVSSAAQRIENMS